MYLQHFNFATLQHYNKNQKAYFAEQKAAMVEESKKGYTGDALALRGDEGRDKLR